MHYTDKALIQLISRRDEAALGQLYDRYSRLVFSVVFGLVGDQATTEEITLDVFTRVWTHADTYQPERAQVRTWLVSIARNRAIDELRRLKVRPQLADLELADLVTNAANSWVNNTPEQSAEIAWRRAQVQIAISALPEEQRQALVLAYFRGYTHSEIAEALEVPLGTVKTRIRLAMGKLRGLLGPE